MIFLPRPYKQIMLLYSMLSRLVLLAVFITAGAIILVLARSVHSNVIIAPTSNQTLPTIVYNCITHCSSQQNAFMDGYKLGAIHATSGHFYDNNCNKDTHYCSVYQAGYATCWDRYIWQFPLFHSSLLAQRQK
jgi:hypothetical protein